MLLVSSLSTIIWEHFKFELSKIVESEKYEKTGRDVIYKLLYFILAMHTKNMLNHDILLETFKGWSAELQTARK